MLDLESSSLYSNPLHTPQLTTYSALPQLDSINTYPHLSYSQLIQANTFPLADTYSENSIDHNPPTFKNSLLNKWSSRSTTSNSKYDLWRQLEKNSIEKPLIAPNEAFEIDSESRNQNIAKFHYNLPYNNKDVSIWQPPSNIISHQNTKNGIVFRQKQARKHSLF